MRGMMGAAALPDPVFVQRTGGTYQVSVTLKNDAEHRKMFVRAEAAAGINPEVYASLTESERMIVNYLADQDKVNVKDAGRVIALDWRATKNGTDGFENKRLI